MLGESHAEEALINISLGRFKKSKGRIFHRPLGSSKQFLVAKATHEQAGPGRFVTMSVVDTFQLHISQLPSK